MSGHWMVFDFGGGTFDGALDIVLGHILTAGFLQKGAQTRVAGNIGAALLHSEGDFLTDFGKGLGHMAPAFEFTLFSEFKSSSHNYSAFSMREIYLSISTGLLRNP